MLTPLAVDPAHPFPYISNLSLSLAVVLRGWEGEERFARVKVPKILSRWVPLPGTLRYLPLEQLIGAHLEALFQAWRFSAGTRSALHETPNCRLIRTRPRTS